MLSRWIFIFYKFKGSWAKCPPRRTAAPGRGAGCGLQLRLPTAEQRYKRNAECELEPMAEGLNDWKKVKFVRKAAHDADHKEACVCPAVRRAGFGERFGLHG